MTNMKYLVVSPTNEHIALNLHNSGLTRTKIQNTKSNSNIKDVSVDKAECKKIYSFLAKKAPQKLSQVKMSTIRINPKFY